MEPNNVPTEMPGEQSGNVAPVPEKKKGGTNVLIWVILLALVAICGVGFGVWMMIDSNNQIDGLNGQISSLKSQNSELLDQLSSSDVDSKDYIYVGEWGIKIKIPENLENVAYEFYSWEGDGAAGDTLCVAGSTSGHGDVFPSFLSEYGGLGVRVCVSKNSESLPEDADAFWPLKMPVGEYYIQGPQAAIGIEDDWAWEVESIDVIKNMLSADNYSVI